MVYGRLQRMHRLIKVLVLLIGIQLLGPANLYAWPWGDGALVTINGEVFTKEDFLHWWENWKEKDTQFPDTPEPFIEWHLLAQEAKSMELYRERNYQHKVNTFLKARTLMILKNEEIDSKIKISDRDLWDQYEQKYSPRWHINILFFDQEAQAQQVYEELGSGRLAINDITEQAMTDRGVVNHEEKWLRPRNCHDAWQDALAGLNTGQVTHPLQMGKGYVVLYLKGQKGPEKADFQSLEPQIRKEVRNMRQAELSLDLVSRLRKKYEVNVDEDLFAELDVNNTQEELMDKILITTNRVNVPVNVFLNQLRKEQNLRGYRHFQTKEAVDYLKKMVLDMMISQTLTTWESMDRHYEERPPFKWVYDFYCRHRLTKELEKRLFLQEIDLSDDKIAAYYKEHLDEFTKPGIVSIIVLKDDKNLADKMWAEIKQGEDFSSVVRKYYSRDIPVQRIPVDHLVPVLKEVVKKMAKGEVSPPVDVDGHSSMVKLVDRTAVSHMPLNEVREQIIQRLNEEEPARLRKNYVEQLLARSDIEINEDAWEKLKNEYGGKK